MIKERIQKITVSHPSAQQNESEPRSPTAGKVQTKLVRNGIRIQRTRRVMYLLQLGSEDGRNVVHELLSGAVVSALEAEGGKKKK